MLFAPQQKRRFVFLRNGRAAERTRKVECGVGNPKQRGKNCRARDGRSNCPGCAHNSNRQPGPLATERLSSMPRIAGAPTILDP